MARPKNSGSLDLSKRVNLTAGAIERLTCPADRLQVFLRDSEVPALRVRATPPSAKNPKGVRAFVFESKLNGQTFRRTIGRVEVWSIEQARAEARRLGVMLDDGQDPRELERQAAAERELEGQRAKQERDRHTVTGLQAWAQYVKEGREIGFGPRGPWGERHAFDHEAMSNPGGIPFKRGKGKTAPGILRRLLEHPLAEIDAAAVSAWLKKETAARPTRAALAFRLLRAFLNWTAEHPTFGQIANPQAHKPKEVRRLVRKAAAKDDALQREHLPAWFKACLEYSDRVTAAYLITLLLTGARPGEIGGMRWDDVDLRFGGSVAIRDKVEGARVIPCPRFVAHLLQGLTRRGPWVFGAGAGAPKTAHNANYHHRRILAAAGLPHVSLHGLRRSFGSLSEWVECPAGVVAQLQGHRPSATAERHYRVRPLDLLRVWHHKIESWMLEQAGVPFAAHADGARLSVVKRASAA